MNHLQYEVFQNDIKEINQDILQQGYQISKSDWNELLTSMNIACSKFQLIETSLQPLHQIIKEFSKSPYSNATLFLPLLKNQVYSYYAIRSLFQWQVRDEHIVKTMYDVYLQHHGVVSTAYVQQCATVLKEDL